MTALYLRDNWQLEMGDGQWSAARKIIGDRKRAFHFSGARRSYTSYPLSTHIRISFPVTSLLRFIE
jgi:hypothetical protein